MCLGPTWLLVVLGDWMKIYLDHIGIACENLDDSSSFWSLLGLIQGDDELVEDQGVTTRFFRQVNDPSTPKIELLEPTSEDTPIGKFL